MTSADPKATGIAYTIAGVIFAITLWMLTMPVARAQSLQDHIDANCRVNCVAADKLVDVAARAAKRFGFDYKALLAIVHVESKYNTRAKNGSSVGLTQALLVYHRPKFLGKDYFAVEDNMFVGAEVFGACFAKHKGNYPTSFSCYNGYGKGDSRYRDKVLKALREIRGLKLPTPSLDPLGDFIARVI